MQAIGNRFGRAAAAGILMLALSAPVAAQQSGKSDDHSAHHPPGAAPAPATTSPGGKPGMMQGMMPMMQGMMGGMMQSGGLSPMMLHHTEGTLAFLKAELQIAAAQEPLWTAFADAMRAAVKKVPPRQAAPAPWPDRLAAREKALEAQLEVVRTYRPAAAALYAALTPEQKKKADMFGTSGMGMRM
jgi:hypothetical protein